MPEQLLNRLTYSGASGQSLIDSDSNLLNHPDADATGLTPSSSAAQEIVDAGLQLYIPNGDWWFDAPVVVDVETNIITERGLMPNYARYNQSNTAPTNTTNGAQCRIFVTENIDFFQFKWGGINLLGAPLLDSSAVDVYTSAGVAYVLNEGRVRGWGGRVEIQCVGNHDTIVNEGNGMDCIATRWDNAVEQFSYITQMNWWINAQDVRHGINDAALDPNGGQFSNGLVAWLDLEGFKKAATINSLSESWLAGRLQAKHVLHPNEHPGVCVEINTPRVERDFVFYDLSSTIGSTGYYKPSEPYGGTGFQPVTKNRGNTARRHRDTIMGVMTENIYSPEGFIPRNCQGTDVEGLVDSKQMNEMFAWQKKGTLVVGAYESDTVSDFSTQTADSVTAAIPASSDITVTNPEGFFAANAILPTITPDTAGGLADFVELHGSGFTIRPATLYVALNCSDQPPLQIQFITKASGVVVDNILESVGFKAGSTSPLVVYRFACAGTSVDEWILRFIGFNGSAGTDFSVHDICALHSLRNNSRRPVIDIEADQAVYGYLDFQGGFAYRLATTAQLEDITSDVNTGAAKRNGYAVKNSDTGKIVTAADASDGGVWEDVLGVTAHTPV